MNDVRYFTPLYKKCHNVYNLLWPLENVVIRQPHGIIFSIHSFIQTIFRNNYFTKSLNITYNYVHFIGLILGVMGYGYSQFLEWYHLFRLLKPLQLANFM